MLPCASLTHGTTKVKATLPTNEKENEKKRYKDRESSTVKEVEIPGGKGVTYSNTRWAGPTGGFQKVKFKTY